jgi:hypothetical protein
VDAGWLPLAQDESWPEVRVERANGEADGDWHLGFGGRRACFRMPGGLLRVERASATMTVRTEQPLPEDQLVHPWLAHGAAMFARWHGRDCFHGGAFVAGDGAWAVFATKTGGKSTLLAWLARQGHGVVSDDLLVLEGGDVFAGARCVDLRPGATGALGANDLPLARGSSRRRLALEPVQGRMPLMGVVHLAWGDEVALTSVPLAERIPLLRTQNAFPVLPADESALLGLTALPTFTLRRPRRLDALAESGRTLLAATCG